MKKITTNVVKKTITISINQGDKLHDIRIDQLENSDNKQKSYIGYYPDIHSSFEFTSGKLQKGEVHELPFDLTGNDAQKMGQKEFNSFLTAFKQQFGS